MRTLSERERRTIRIAAVAIAAYLTLFYGLRVAKHLERERSQYRHLVLQAQTLKVELQRYETRVLLLEKLKKSLQMEAGATPKASLVGQASAAIQQAAQSCEVQLGPIRESPGSAAGRELASMQIEGTGQIPAIMTLLHRLDTLGYPLIVDSIQVNPDSSKPGALKLRMTVLILDFEQWKKEEAPRNV